MNCVSRFPEYRCVKRFLLTIVSSARVQLFLAVSSGLQLPGICGLASIATMSSEAVAEIPEGSVEGDVAVAAPAAAEAPAVLQRWDFSFPEGPLGISLGNDRSIGKVFEGSTAGQAGVLAGDVLTHVAGKDVSAIHYAEVLNLIKAAPRPVVLSFLRNGPASPGAHAHAPRASIASAKTAVRKAGSYVKGFLDSSVKIVQAFDKAIDRAIDDSTKVIHG